jgi:serine/threonine protein kinase
MSQQQAASQLEYRAGDQPVPGYTLVKELGRGAMGVVWLAQTESGFERALKIINLTQRGGKKEYRGLRTIKQRKLLHGNLLTLIDYWLKDAEGKFVPDKDELDDSDSFFAPTTPDNDPRPWKMAATTPQSRGTTDANPHAATRLGEPAAPAPQVQRSATLVSRGTVTEGPAHATQVGPVDQTTDFAAGARQQRGRPVQLIVAMELGHKTLDDRQKQCQEDRLPGLPAEELLAYMEQAARGLDYLHREGIVHRDIKPGNIMLVGDVAKVCDYGLIVTTDADLRATSNAFTPLYASPEAVGEKPVTGQSDQYSLAVSYIELRTGHTPYTSETAASVYAAKETGKYELSRIRNSTVRNVLKRALATAPGDRYGSCSQFIRELEKAEKSGSGLLWIVGAAAAVVLLAVGGALAVPYLRPPSVRAPGNGEDVVVSPADAIPVRPPKPKAEEPVLPPPPPEMRKVVDEARKLRLAGKFDEAAEKLQEFKIDAASADAAHWPYQLERLHLEISRQFESTSAVSSSQWETWQQAAARLQRFRGPAAEQAELAALQLFIATRLDPAQLSLDQPLADDLARAADGVQHWNEVLALPEQKKLQALFAGAAERVVASRKALPDAWKARFTQIWPAAKGAELLAHRVQQCIQGGNAAALGQVANDFDEIADQSDWSASPSLQALLAQVRLEVKQAQDRLRVQSLHQRLTNDDFLASATARKALLDEIQALGDTSELPLASLLRIEAELADLDASGKRYSVEQIDDLRAIVGRLSNTSDAAQKEWLDYGRFLLARAEIHIQRRGSKLAPAEPASVLMSWPETSTADWHTPRRREQAIETLVDIADGLLAISADRPYELSREVALQAPAAASYLQKAQRLGGASPDLAGLLALALGVTARQTNAAEAWQQAAECAERAIAEWPSVTDKERQTKLPAVRYVAALAASRLNDAAAVERNRQAVATLAALLKHSFRDDAPANRTVDQGLLENVVLPGLKLPLAGDAAPGEELAALWGAKGRLIERNPNSVLLALPGVDPASHGDEYARAMLTAHTAYAQANKLHDDVIYAAGAARTLLKLPREVFDWQKYEAELNELVRGRDDAARANPSLLYAEACVLRRRAALAAARPQKLQLLADSLDRFARLNSATRDADPYSIRGVALCAASDTNLKAAFWSPIQASDESRAADGRKTKYFYLQEALNAASGAQSDGSRLLPEEARTALGNALEDLGFYYKETDKYPQSAAAFEEAVDQIGRGRSKAYALMSLGRCQYRWAMDAAAIDGNPQERVKRLREAFQSLADAVEQARSSDPAVAPEASFWLATVKWESALSGPGNLALAPAEGGRGFRDLPLAELKSGLDDASRKADAAKELADRLRQMDEARQNIVQAASEARGHSAAEWASYLPTAALLGKKLADQLQDLLKRKLPINLDPTAVTADSQKQASELLTATAAQAGLLSASQRRTLVDLLLKIQWQAEPSAPKAAKLVQDYESLFADPTDDARAQLVLLRLVRANFSPAPDFHEAEDIAGQIMDPAQAHWARGYCEKFHADALLKPYRLKLQKYRDDPARSKDLTLADDDAKLRKIQDRYAAALDELTKSSDAKTVANLSQLCRAPLAEIESGKWHAALSNLEIEQLRETIEETAAIRGQLYELLDARISLHQADWKLKGQNPLPADGKASLRLLLDSLKPIRFLEVRFSEVRFDDYVREFLRTCEARIGN